MKLFAHFIDMISEWSGRLFSYLILIATFLITVEVIMRYAFNSPTTWSLELTIILCGTTYLMGGAYALRYDAHVRVDALYNTWTPRTKALVDVITIPIFFLGLIVLFWIGLQWTIQAYVGHETLGEMWSPIIWPVRAFIPISALLIMLQGVAKFYRDLEVVRKGGHNES